MTRPLRGWLCGTKAGATVKPLGIVPYAARKTDGRLESDFVLDRGHIEGRLHAVVGIGPRRQVDLRPRIHFCYGGRDLLERQVRSNRNRVSGPRKVWTVACRDERACGIIDEDVL